MDVWQGTIIIEDCSIEATVYHEQPAGSVLKEWYGYGMSTRGLMPGSYETSIGTILITSSDPVARSVNFHGTGVPKGPFAEAMGVNRQ